MVVGSRLPFACPALSALILCEGVENALIQIWQAHGQETWACLGIPNIARAPGPCRQNPPESLATVTQ